MKWARQDDRATDEEASDAYGRIITRYPAMDRALDAKERLEALHQPVPRPTRADARTEQEGSGEPA
jgi:hypothetical protein